MANRGENFSRRMPSATFLPSMETTITRGREKDLKIEVFFSSQTRIHRLTLPPAKQMVVVAQLVEPRIVIPVVAGSSPVDHPIFLIEFDKPFR